MESWEVPHDAVGIGLPDGEGVVDVSDVNDQVVVSNEHSLGSQVGNRVEFVVQGIRFLSGKEQILDIVKICPHTWYSSYMTTESSVIVNFDLSWKILDYCKQLQFYATLRN